jgi:hypothetical protein
MKWLAAHHPELVGRYRRLYGQGSYASKEYRTWLSGRVNHFKAKHGFTGTHGFSHRNARPATPATPGADAVVGTPLPGQERLF